MKPFIEPIGKNATDSHQTSPSWIVTFTRFNTRDTFNYGELGPKKLEPVRGPLVVENDCISISIETAKTNHTPKATLTLFSGDLNYSTAVSPGDFFIVNIVNSPQKARDIRIKAGNGKKINKPGYGFKGVFKVNSVNKIMSVDPSSGQKTLRYQVIGYAFTEFNNIIYFNPTLPVKELKNLLFNINLDLSVAIGERNSVQEVLQLLPNIFLGGGKISPTGAILSTKKNPYVIPKDLFKLLGIDGSFAIDLYRIMIGVWTKFNDKSSLAKGMNPTGINDNQQIQTLTKSLSGRAPAQTTPLTNITSLEIIKRFSNPLINEMYTCFRLDSKTGLILPKMIIRQKPFTTNHFEHFLATKGKFKSNPAINYTKFLELPRWKISSDLIYNLSFSKNESLRFNLVHIVGSTSDGQKDQTIQTFANSDSSNVYADEIDIQRHGLRPYTKISNFDWTDKPKGYSPEWAALCFDWVYGGHLRLNGTISCVGIEDDICIGDNLELHNTVFHIESIQHVAGISPDGKKMFRTNLSLTHGMDKRSGTEKPVYPEMDFTDTLKDRIDDYEFGEQILPGFSDTQDILGREKGEEKKETVNKSYTPADAKEKK